MFKRFISMSLCLACLLFLAAPVGANTVEFNLENIGDLKISAFQLFFFSPDDTTYQYPVDQDSTNFPPQKDFTVNFEGAGTYSDFWNLDSYIKSEAKIDFARGIGGYADPFNSLLSLNEGPVLSMTSNNSFFGIDANNPSMAFFDFNGTNGENITSFLKFETTWEGDKQIVTASASAVPIPSALLLFGSGLAGMLGIRRKIKR